jgi:hypothetical protein
MVRLRRDFATLPQRRLADAWGYASPDLPEAVLALDQPVGVASPDVAAAHLHCDSVDGRACDRPLRHPTCPAGEVVVVAVVDVRNALEARCEAPAYLFLADETAAPAVNSAWRLEDAPLSKVGMGHDRVEVVPVERVEHLSQSRELAVI